MVRIVDYTIVKRCQTEKYEDIKVNYIIKVYHVINYTIFGSKCIEVIKMMQSIEREMKEFGEDIKMRTLWNYTWLPYFESHYYFLTLEDCRKRIDASVSLISF